MVMASLHKNYFQEIFSYFRRFIDISQEEFDEIIPFFEIRDFPKKTKVVKIGEVDRYFNIIVKGLVRKYLLENKKEVTLQLSTEGHMIHAEISFNLQVPSDCTVETIEPSTFVSLSYSNLQLVYEKFPKMERLGRLIITDMFIKKDYRDLDQLKKTTRERFLDYMNNHPDMLQRVPQKYLASYLNIKAETFSRLKHLIRSRKTKEEN
ncbi:MAG: cyclic nucleotide-binding domain-containing protein [Gemmatimonadaceae bacterium]|nr:cyclic nucleotide-binding domain-containing protein [Chitinophagaceae bacterium]